MAYLRKSVACAAAVLVFLEYMIQHHEGALTMVQDLLDDGDAQDPELFQLASHIDGDQRIEINRMSQLLAETS